MLQTVENGVNKKRNSDYIDDTYYEYHGRHDDGDSPADNYGFMIEEGIAV